MPALNRTPKMLKSAVATVLRHMEAEVRKIETDDRYTLGEHKGWANTDINAPLALIQLEMRARRHTIMRYAAMLRGEK